MTRFQWVGLSLILWCTITIATGQLRFSNVNSEYCQYVLTTIDSIEIAVLFNLSMLIGYKINCLCREINGFAL